jgi:lipopolysaccharide assembly outer membrane protein LptD (OstA)
MAKEEGQDLSTKDSTQRIKGVVNTGEASTTVYSAGADRHLLWRIWWHKMSASLANGGLKIGRMIGVRAEIHGAKQASENGSTITADAAVADEVAKRLNLVGHVVLLSHDKKSKLSCDSLQYDSKHELLEADGNVRFRNTVGTMGTFPKLNATSDLHRIGTPDLFQIP